MMNANPDKQAIAKLNVDNVTYSEIAKVYMKAATRKYYKIRNSIRNGMWPTSAGNLYLCCLAFYLISVIEPQSLTFLTQRLKRWSDTLNSVFPFKLPEVLAPLPVASVVSFLFMCNVMFIRQLVLRALLSYRGWMYESMRNPPLKIKLWAVIVRLFSGYQPSLYSFQRSLPRMTVPPVNQTINQLIESMRCILNKTEFESFELEARKFESTLAHKLQRLLIAKSWLTQNYVSDWWEKYVYLRSRTPLANNCNYYIMDQSYWRATEKPVARAASLIANVLRFKQLVDREELPPLVLRDTIPICMSQYERLFSTVRIPQLEIDELVHYDSTKSKHIVVVCKGVYYKLNCYDIDNNPLSAKKIEEYIQYLVDDAEKETNNLNYEQKSISSLTALERTNWAKIRSSKLFTNNQTNKQTLELVESSMFIVWILIDDKPVELSDRAKLAFQGNKDYRYWFDKCFNIVVFGDGHCAINCEHSLCDAPAYAHMWEYTLCKDVLECTFDSEGSCFPPLQTYRQSTCQKPSKLEWDVDAFYVDENKNKNNDDNDDDKEKEKEKEAQNNTKLQATNIKISLRDEIKRANEIALKANADVDLKVLDHSNWGKGAIKKCKVSPDAFVQLAIQMAYYKDNNKFVQTYEASMTRLYLNGRTETVRSCTAESCAFVLAMLNNDEKNSVSLEDKIKLLHAAGEKHTQLYKDAMNGKGIDRHLFALYVASKGLGYECEFLADLLSRPWTLSTSQTPHTQQTNVPDPNYQNFNDKLCSGGGFMAVSDDGYGVSYLFPSNHRIFFHISSRKSCPTTDTTRFGKLLFESLDEILALFEDDDDAAAAAANDNNKNERRVNADESNSKTTDKLTTTNNCINESNKDK